jgi:hypothetical protein
MLTIRSNDNYISSDEDDPSDEDEYVTINMFQYKDDGTYEAISNTTSFITSTKYQHCLYGDQLCIDTMPNGHYCKLTSLGRDGVKCYYRTLDGRHVIICGARDTRLAQYKCYIEQQVPRVMPLP